MKNFINIVKGLFHFHCKIETVLLFTGSITLYKKNSSIVFLPVKVCTKCGKLHGVDLNQKWYTDDMSKVDRWEATSVNTYLKINETTKLKQPTLSDKAITELKPYCIYNALKLDPRAKPIPNPDEDIINHTHELY